MTAKAKLKEIIQDMQMQNDELRGYFNRKTGKVTILPTAVFHFLETEVDDDDAEEEFLRFHGLHEDDLRTAETIINEDTFVSLPSQWDINEHQIIRDFCDQFSQDRIAQALRDTLRGRGAIRQFKDEAFRLGVIEDWYAFRDKAYRDIAITWCKEHDILFGEG